VTSCLGPYARLAVWIDGRIVRGGEAAVSVWDHGLLYGDGCFEGLRISGHRLFRAAQHHDRLERAARFLQLGLRHPAAELIAVIAAVAAANELRDAHVRLVLTRGATSPGERLRWLTNASSPASTLS